MTVGPHVGPALPHPPVFGLDSGCHGDIDTTFNVPPLSTEVSIVTTGEPDTATMGTNYASGATAPLHGMTVIGNACNAASPSPTFGSVGTIVQNPGVPCPAAGSWGGTFIEANSVYVVFVQHNVTLEWAAVTITPVGRVRVWFWNGSAWG